MCCARCGEPFEPMNGSYLASLDHELVSAGTDSNLDDAMPQWSLEPAPAFDEVIDFEIEADLRRLEQVVQRFREGQRRQRRVDAEVPHEVPQWHVPVPARTASLGIRLILGLSWLSLAGGLMGFMCGGVLAWVAAWRERPELWPAALPALIGGQFLLLLGLVGLYDLLWRQRHAHAQSTPHWREREGLRAEEGHRLLGDRPAPPAREHRQSLRIN